VAVNEMHAIIVNSAW